MRLRYYAAIITGALTQIMTLAALWMWTEIDIAGMLFWSVCGYITGIAAVLYATEPRKRQRTRWELQIYDLEKKDERKVG